MVDAFEFHEDLPPIPAGPLTKTKQVRLDIYDPKQDTVRYVPEGFDVHQHETAESAVRAAFESGENGVVVVEELLTVEKKEYKILRHYAAIRRRRIDGLGPAIYATTQRPVTLPVEFRAIGDHYICGQLVEPNDIKVVSGVTGSEYADRLPGLVPGEFILHRI